MVLNNKPQMFTFYFPSNFWYQEVQDTWNPIINRMKLPYEDVEDFMNQQVQQVTFPSMNFQLATQQRGQYDYGYRSGKELEALMDKTLKITFKLTESYLSYWILWDQMDRYLHYHYPGSDIEFKRGQREVKPLFMEPLKLGFLNDAGIQMFEFTFYEITPTSTSEINLSYAATVASYNTFTWSLRYNRFELN
jgi:hypothetical protein